MNGTTLRNWIKGRRSPGVTNIVVLSRLEHLFKVPAGTLNSRIPCPNRRSHLFRLPSFLREDFPRQLTYRISRHLPDGFCDMDIQKQREVVDSILLNVIGCTSPEAERNLELRKLSYRLKQWPSPLKDEFDDLAAFKTAERAPLGMLRNGRWRETTREIIRRRFSFFFGAICLPEDATDPRMRGVGIPPEHLTMALIACPALADCYIRFLCESRSQYTDMAPQILNLFLSLLRPKTGWLCQQPELASRLRPSSCGSVELVSEELISRAHSEWDWICDSAVDYYKRLIDEITPLVKVSRDSFRPIEGIVRMNDPMEAFKIMIGGMKNALPDRQTHAVQYHLKVRNLFLVTLIAVTGLRRNTISQLNFSDDGAGHLSFKDGGYVLTIPRTLFKDENSPYFGPKHAKVDYEMKLPDFMGLNATFSEYLNISRPILMSYHPSCREKPLFVAASNGKTARLTPSQLSAIYAGETEKHLAENKWRRTGIALVLRHGIHTARHIRGTAVVKKTGSLQIAADANHNSEATARKHYIRYLPVDRNSRVNDTLFGETKEEEKKTSKKNNRGKKKRIEDK